MLPRLCDVSYQESRVSSPVVDDVRDDGGEEAEQHDRRAGVHDRVQKLPGVRGERQHLLHILKQTQGERDANQSAASCIKMTLAKSTRSATIISAPYA